MEIGKRLCESPWFKAQVEKEASKDKLPDSERFGQIASLVFGVIFLIFFAIHDTRPTGFFTEDFGTGDAILLYALLLVGMVAPLMRLVFNRKNIARPIEAAGMVFMILGSIYFLVTFPFDFSNFAEPLPKALEPLLDWFSATLAKWILGIGIVVGPIFAVYTSALYFGVKKRLSEIGDKSQA